MNNGMTGLVYHKSSGARVRVIFNQYESTGGLTGNYFGEMVDYQAQKSYVFTSLLQYNTLFDFLGLNMFEHIHEDITR